MEGQTFEVHNKTDGRASSLIILPEPDDVDEPFPTTDADAYLQLMLNLIDVKESPLSNRPEAVDDGALG